MGYTSHLKEMSESQLITTCGPSNTFHIVPSLELMASSTFKGRFIQYSVTYCKFSLLDLPRCQAPSVGIFLSPIFNINSAQHAGFSWGEFAPAAGNLPLPGQGEEAREGAREGVRAAAQPNILLTPAKEKNIDNNSSFKFPMMQY